MGPLRVEPTEGDLTAACACCAGEVGLRGFVFEDDVPRAVYFVEPLGVPNYPMAKIGVVIGDWTPGAPRRLRETFAFICRPTETGTLLTAAEAKMAGFPELAMLGALVEPQILAEHRRRTDFKDLTRAVIAQDWRLSPLREIGRAERSPSRFTAEPI